MAITDLTGYTWVGNENIDLDSFGDNYYDLFIEHISGDAGIFQLLRVSEDVYWKLGLPKNIPYDDTGTHYNYNWEDGYGSWDNGVGKMHILGGPDVTNQTLIAWLQANGTLQTVSTKVSVDLTTLPGWSSLPSDTYSITIVAKADGYKDSEPSEGVTVTKEAEADALAGTWVLNDTITFSSSSSGLPNINSFNFTSNNTLFYGFYFDVNSDGDNSLGYRTNQEYSADDIYNSSGNIISGKEAYKTIIITSKLSEVENGDLLLTWLQANATKQSVTTPTLISFTIAGTSYQAEEGMTWGEWVESSYNTDGFAVFTNTYIALNASKLVSTNSNSSGSVLTSDVIESDYSYQLAGSGSGN